MQPGRGQRASRKRSDSVRAAERFASADEHRAVDLFLAHEAELNDSRRYWEWADLVEEGFTYQVPVPRTPAKR